MMRLMVVGSLMHTEHESITFEAIAVSDSHQLDDIRYIGQANERLFRALCK